MITAVLVWSYINNPTFFAFVNRSVFAPKGSDDIFTHNDWVSVFWMLVIAFILDCIIFSCAKADVTVNTEAPNLGGIESALEDISDKLDKD
jgi:hypothetical protein